MKRRTMGAVPGVALALWLGLAPAPADADILTDGYITVREGDADNAMIGYSVATAGDVNGDGFSDVLLNGRENNGTVWCYHGNAISWFGDPDWTVNGGTQPNAWLGCRAAPAGDVNADGYGDVLVGAPIYTNGETSEGAVFVYLGSSSGLSTTPQRVLEGNLMSAGFGSYLDTAGDVNGDGYDDIVIGSPTYSGGQAGEGRALVYLGSANGIPATPAWVYESNMEQANLGRRVAGTGDVNADGYDDILVAAPDLSAGHAGEGGVYIFLGSPSGPAPSPSWVYESHIVGGRAGWGLGCAGDVNGDGYADVVFDVGTNNPASGAVLVFFGGPDGPGTVPNRTFPSNSGAFGDVVYAAGDVNGDGFSDLIAGDSSFNNQSGSIKILGGIESGATFPVLAERYGVQANELFGIDCRPAGDVNGDGFGDVIIGAPRHDNGQTDEGAVRLYLGHAATPNYSPAWSPNGVEAGSWYGYAVAQGDWNGDGYADLAVGFPYHDVGGIDSGSVVVYYGGPTGYTIPANWFMPGSTPYALFGHAVANAGDIDNDGCEELIVGEPYYGTFDFPGVGAAHIFKGTPNGLGSSPWWEQSGGILPQAFGYAVAGAGDVNGDGYADVLIGAPFHEFPFERGGGAYLYLGSADGLSETYVWGGHGGTTDDWFGYSVAMPGDMDGDGYGDIAVGAPMKESDAFAPNEGFLYVFYGSPTGIDGGWGVDSNQQDAQFGYRLAAGGDLNGDGRSDLLHGAPLWDASGAPDCGRVEAYMGAPGQYPVLSWFRRGTFAGDWMGFAVAGAGDLNGDGRSDLAVGAIADDYGAVNGGAVYIHMGNADAVDPMTALLIPGTQPSGKYGFAVSISGDVTGDGFADLIVGEPGYTVEHYGRAYCYYGAREALPASEDGASRIPRQLRSDLDTIIQPLGLSDRADGFDFGMLVRSARGRSTQVVEYEVATPGSPWSGNAIPGGTYDTGFPVPGRGSAALVNLSASGLEAGAPYRWRMRFVGDSPFFPWTQWFSISGNAPGETDLRTGPGSSDVAEDGAGGADGPGGTALRFTRVGPNPCRDAVSFSYTLPSAGPARMTVHDLTGRRVATLADGEMESGSHVQAWDTRDQAGRRVPAGVYMVRLRQDGRAAITQIVVQ